MGYSQLNESTCCDYLRSIELFPRSVTLEAHEVGDGNINLVFIVKNTSDMGSVVIKQALPYVRCVGESWPLDLGRTAREGWALRVQNNFVPGLVPELLHLDEELALIIMEDLSHLEVMRRGMIQMHRYPCFAEHISTFLANMGFYTSDAFMDSEEKKHQVKAFINPELCRIVEDLVFTDPYYDSERNNINPALRPYLERVFWKKSDLRLEAAKFKYKFLTEAQSLLHGDLHTGSIFADPGHTKVFDPEFAFFGPTGYDIGKLIGNLFINYISWNGRDQPDEIVKSYREYLLQTTIDIQQRFEAKFTACWRKDARDVITSIPGYREFYLRNIFVDTIGFAGICMIRRVHGLAHNHDVDGIGDLQRRRDVQIKILEVAEGLIMLRDSFSSIAQVTESLKEQIF